MRIDPTPEAMRRTVMQTAHARGVSFAGLSRVLGRHKDYVSRYVREGCPEVLSERDRRTLAAFLDVPVRDFALQPPAPKAKPRPWWEDQRRD